MRTKFSVVFPLILLLAAIGTIAADPVIIDHNCTDLKKSPGQIHPEGKDRTESFLRPLNLR